MAFCKQCGAHRREGARFCTGCGAAQPPAADAGIAGAIPASSAVPDDNAQIATDPKQEPPAPLMPVPAGEIEEERDPGDPAELPAPIRRREWAVPALITVIIMALLLIAILSLMLANRRGSSSPANAAPVPTTVVTNNAAPREPMAELGATRANPDHALKDSVEQENSVIAARRAQTEAMGGATIFINNQTSRTITGFYLYGYDTNWSLTLQYPIGPRSEGRIEIPASGLPCNNHLMTEFSDGQMFNAGNVPLCPVTTINVGEPNEPDGD